MDCTALIEGTIVKVNFFISCKFNQHSWTNQSYNTYVEPPAPISVAAALAQNASVLGPTLYKYVQIVNSDDHFIAQVNKSLVRSVLFVDVT